MIIKKKGYNEDQVREKTEEFCLLIKEIHDNRESSKKTEPIETKTEPIETKTEPIETKTEPIETKTEEATEVEKTDDVIEAEMTEKEIVSILKRRKERQEAKKTADAEIIIEPKSEETKTEPIDWANKDFGPIPKSKTNFKPIKKIKPIIKKIIIIGIIIAFSVLFLIGLNVLTAGKTTETDVTTNNVEMPLSFYEDTGISGSAEYKDFVVNDNQYLIIGGVFVAIDGVPYKYGAYIGLGPGTYNFNVNTGFISVVSSKDGPGEFDFRVNQAIQNRWLHSTVDRGPIPVSPIPVA